MLNCSDNLACESCQRLSYSVSHDTDAVSHDQADSDDAMMTSRDDDVTR